MTPLRTALAHLAHRQWSHAVRSLLREGTPQPDGTLLLSRAYVADLKVWSMLPYERLGVLAQADALAEADTVLAVIRADLSVRDITTIYAWRGRLRLVWAGAWAVYAVAKGLRYWKGDQ